MELLIDFFGNYGIALTVIAIFGIIILGILKYFNLFNKAEESKRHYIYLAISVGFSLIATAVYLLIIGKFETGHYFAAATSIFILNQTFYNLFKITPVNGIFVKLLDFIKNILIKKNG